MDNEKLKKANELQGKIDDVKSHLEKASRLKNSNRRIVITDYDGSREVLLEKQEATMFIAVAESRLNERLKELQAEFEAL